MNFILEASGPYAGRRDVDKMCEELAAQPPANWRTHAQRWTDAGTALQQASGDLGGSVRKVTIWQQSTGSEGWKAFSDEVNAGVTFLQNWQRLTAGVAQRLNHAADALEGAKAPMDHLLQYWNQAKQKANSSDGPVIQAGMREMEDAGFWAAIEMNIVSDALTRALDGVQAEFAKNDWAGPVVAKEPAGGPQPRPQDQGGGAGTDQAKAGDAQIKADEKAPDDKSPDEKKPEAKDPVEEAGKLIDVVGKGIDLVGKVPENLDKWITLAQHAKDLVDPGTTATTTTTDPAKSLPTDHPALAGGSGTTTAPTFHASASPPPAAGSGLGQVPIGSFGGGGGGVGALGNSGAGHVSGTSERTTPAQKSATVAGTAGAEPTLSGKASAPTTSSQQSMPPMYPPQSGTMGAGGNGARDVKPGGGTGRRPGFNVPTEQSETERLRRHGVQSDLQGRSNGETRTTAGAPALRKRKRPTARPAEREVLDEDLWRI